MAALIRSRDWAQTPLGDPATWPASLRTVLRLMLTSRFAMWMGWGADLAFFYNDAYARRTLGAKHPWALGRPAREVWAEVWPELDVRVTHVLRSGGATWDEGLLLFLERSGYPEETYHTFSYSAAPADGPGEVGGLFCVVVEETERVIGERRIALLQEFAALLGQTNSAEDVFAALERCLGANARDMPFALAYLFEDDGKSARRAAQTGFDDEHPAALERVAVDSEAPWPLREVLANGASIVVALSLDRRWPTGAWEKAPANAIVVPIAYQGHARPAGVFVAGLNPHRPLDKGLQSFVELFVGQLAAALSNARAYDEERRRADALAEVDRAKTAFFSNVSHEFRTPLTLMLGPTEDALGSPDRVLRGADLETVHRNELRLLKLVNALLDFARIEAGRIEASYEPTDLAALTTDLASSFRSAIERAGVILDVDCPPLPAPIYVDHDMWEKIVLNLLSNALKFTFEGRIGVALRSRAGFAELTLSDTGVGVAPGELPRLFERFHRVEGTRARTHEGSGIGLALVHELVRLHGGTIDVTSEIGKGTTFTIAIPGGTGHLPQERISVARRITPTTASSAYVAEALRWTRGADSLAPATPREPGDRPRIVVADDNADMRDYIARLLRERWVVEAFADGRLALEAIRREEPALVLSDVMMPGLDGFGLIRALRADPKLRSVPVILLSARAGEEASEEGLTAGADDYIVKPFAARDLVVRVASRLAAAQSAREANAIKENLYRHFLQAPFPIAVFRGPKHVVELANRVTLRAWGRTEADVLGRPLVEGVPQFRGQPFMEALDSVVASGKSYEGNAELARLPKGPNGELEDAYFTFVYAPLLDARGSTEGVLMSAFDVTAQVRARIELERAAAARARALAEAERTSRAKDEFLATMSHELRTPLNAMLGWARILRSGQTDGKRVDHGLAVIERNAETQARLVSDLLDVSRIISGKLRLSVQPVSVATIVLAALDVVRQAADSKGISLEVNLDPDLGQILGDPDRLQQIVWNLLANAVKFTPARGRVSISAARENSTVAIRVDDTGAGIASEHLPFIFERFRQVDSSTTRAHGGLGLGLAIVRHLAEAHGGTVQAKSEGLGQGALFTVVLPLRAVFVETEDARANGAPEDGPRVTAASALKRLNGARVLVVDDDEDSLDLLRVVLEGAGASVTAVASAAHALEGTSRQKFDAVISDIGMPEMDGYAFIRRLRERDAEVPAIALTAYARAEDAERAHQAGYNRHVAKPVDANELLAIVEKILR